MQKYFLIVITTCVLFITLSVGYYFVYALPKMNAEKLELERKSEERLQQKQDADAAQKKIENDIEKGKKEEEQQKQDEQKRKEEAKQQSAALQKIEIQKSLDLCLSLAYRSYEDSWGKACAKQLNRDNSLALATVCNYDTQRMYGRNREQTDALCNEYKSTINTTADPHCSLIAGGKSIEENYKNLKDDCYKRYPIN